MWGPAGAAGSALPDDVAGSCAEAGLDPATSSSAAAEAPAIRTNVRRKSDAVIACPFARSRANLRLLSGSFRPAEVRVLGDECSRRRTGGSTSPLITKNQPRMVPAGFDFSACELERAQLGGDVHPFGKLEPDGTLRIRSVERVQDVDREPALVEP